MIMTTRARTGGAVGRVDDPSSCPLDAHYSQLKLMQRPAVLSPVRSSRSLSLSLSSSLSLLLSLVSLSLLLPLGPFLCAFARLLFLEKVKNNENSQAAIMAI